MRQATSYVAYAKGFLDAINSCPTVYHWAENSARLLEKAGFIPLSEREAWEHLKPNGKYYVMRNGSAILAFTLPPNFDRKDDILGIGVIGTHIDANCWKLKPSSKKERTDGYVAIGVAPCGAPLEVTWRDRDLGLGGRVIVRSDDGSISSRLVLLDGPIGKIHYMANIPDEEANNPETQLVPFIGLQLAEDHEATEDERHSPLFGKHELSLIRAVSEKLQIRASQIIDWELEMFASHEATFFGLSKEFISCPRLDDKLCSYAALESIMMEDSCSKSGINMVVQFDNEEIGSQTRQGGKSEWIQATVDRIFAGSKKSLVAKLYANSFLVSSDVAHATNPNFTNAYLDKHHPKLNTGMVLKIDPNGKYTSDGASIAFIEEIARKTGNKLQYFQVRNDFPSGSTIGPALSTSTGIQSLDMGIPQLSMHSVRAMTGVQDIYLGVRMFAAFLREWDEQRQLCETN